MRSQRRKGLEARRKNKKGDQLVKDQKRKARERLDAMWHKQRSSEDILHANAIIKGLLPRLQGSVDAWCRKRVPMKVDLHAGAFVAYTDFRTITLNIPEGEVSVDFAGDIRGLTYHEAGHILRSVPFVNLCMANGCLVPPMTDDSTLAAVINEWLVDNYKLPLRTVQNAWNILEDQRMETGMVQESKNLGHYYNVIVLTHVLRLGISESSHLWLYGRRHVDADVRAVAKRKCSKVHGKPFRKDAERIIGTYMGATDLTVMFQAVIEFVALLQQVQDTIPMMDTHEMAQPMGNAPAADKAESGAAPLPEAGNAEGEGDEDDDAPDMLNDAINDLLKEAMKEAREQRNKDGNLTNDVRSYNEAKGAGRYGTPLERLSPLPNIDAESVGRAMGLNRTVRNLMEQARAEAAPSWQQQQRSGVLDVMRYKTRQPGDMEFFRAYAEGGDLRYPNLAVSVLLDGSGSMSRHDEALGIAAFGMKSACDAANVPCTVAVYDSNAYILWDADERAYDVPVNFIPHGSTDPYEAMQLLDGQMHDKRRHLVIIMTDGHWSGWTTHHSLADYALPDRDVVIFYYQTPVTRLNGAETCTNIQIDDLNEMPRHLSRYIARAL